MRVWKLNVSVYWQVLNCIYRHRNLCMCLWLDLSFTRTLKEEHSFPDIVWSSQKQNTWIWRAQLCPLVWSFCKVLSELCMFTCKNAARFVLFLCLYSVPDITLFCGFCFQILPFQHCGISSFINTEEVSSRLYVWSLSCGQKSSIYPSRALGGRKQNINLPGSWTGYLAVLAEAYIVSSTVSACREAENGFILNFILIHTQKRLSSQNGDHGFQILFCKIYSLGM